MWLFLAVESKTKNIFFSFEGATITEKKIDGIIDVTLFDGVEGPF